MQRRDLMTWAGLMALAGASPAEAAKLPNAVVPKGRGKVTHEPFGDLEIYFEGPTDQLKSVTGGSLRLKAGMEPHPPHAHPEEEFMIITEGTGEIVVEGKTTKVGPGSMMYCAGGRPHGIKNTGSAPLLFYFYKWMAQV